jgi:hypothetical protein
MKYAIDRTFAASLSAIVLGTAAAVLTAAGGQPGAPLAGQFWIVPLRGRDHGGRRAGAQPVRGQGVTLLLLVTGLLGLAVGAYLVGIAPGLAFVCGFGAGFNLGMVAIMRTQA